MTSDKILREQLVFILKGGNAHITTEKAISGFPAGHINTYPTNIPYTGWQLLEHIRIAQRDILEFINNPQHQSPDWPEGYWPVGFGPAKDKKATKSDWENTINLFLTDLEGLQKIVEDPKTNLTNPLPHAPGYNILREILLAADHNAYHIGQLVMMGKSINVGKR